MITEYRVGLTQDARQWVEATRLQQRAVRWEREQVAPLLGHMATTLTTAERNQIRNLAVSLYQLGQIQLKQGSADCLASYQESYELLVRIADQQAGANVALDLGTAYQHIAVIRDLHQAEQ